MVEMAGVYGDALTLTCILNEGTCTVSSNALVETGKMGTNTYAMGTEVSEGDFVALSDNTYHTYANRGGLPVVAAASATDGRIGIVKSVPVWNKIPGSTRSWAVGALTAGTYRVASVVFPGCTMAFKALSDGGAAISAGNPVNWDASENAFVDATDFAANVGGTFSFHYNAADDTSILVGVGMWGGASGNADMAAFDVQAQD